MSTKKPPCANKGEETGTKSLRRQAAEPISPPRYKKTLGASISLHERGFLTSAPSVRIPPPPGTSKRGTIKGWSARSRMRLRRALLSLQPPASSTEWAVTLTVPGPVVTPERYKAMWAEFALKACKRGWSGIWRAEVQARGALHWHVVLHLPPAFESSDAVDLWHEVLGRPELVGIRSKPTEDDPEPEWEIYGSRIECPGAVRYSAKVDASDGSERWWRYLCDHTSKSKQEQIGAGIGRHWGIIGRKRYSVHHPDVQRVSDGVFFRVLRALQRLSTTAHKEPKAPFGRKLGKRMRRGHGGRSVWFTSPEVVKRLIVHFAREESDAVRPRTVHEVVMAARPWSGMPF